MLPSDRNVSVCACDENRVEEQRCDEGTRVRLHHVCMYVCYFTSDGGRITLYDVYMAYVT